MTGQVAFLAIRKLQLRKRSKLHEGFTLRAVCSESIHVCIGELLWFRECAKKIMFIFQRVKIMLAY